MASIRQYMQQAAEQTPKRTSIYDATSDDTILRRKYPDKYELPGTGQMRSEATLLAKARADADVAQKAWAAEPDPAAKMNLKLGRSVGADRIVDRRKREYGD